MTDGGCQTNEFELPPPPFSSSFNTPLKSWGRTVTSPLFGAGLVQAADAPTIDMGVQATPSGPNAPVLAEGNEVTPAQNVPEPFSIAASYPGLFGTPQPADRGFVQTSTSTALQTPTQPIFPVTMNAGPTFGDVSGSSVGFGFGQQSQPPPDTVPFTPSRPPNQSYEAHPYPDSYLAHHEPSDPPVPTSHNPFSETPKPSSYDPHEYETISAENISGSHVSPFWTATARAVDSSGHLGHLDATEAVGSDDIMSQGTPPGMIPPRVEDGTRNVDEMEREGILSRAVYRQGVPQEALPDGEDASAGEEDDPMDSDQEADYDEDAKGDDYDLRNYGRVSDDEEGYDDEDGPLPDGELIDEEEDDDEDEEDDYDSDDYEEDEDEEETYHSQAPRFPPPRPSQPAPPKEPVIIDLLSDSDDDDEATAPQVPQIQDRPQLTSESSHNATQISLPLAASKSELGGPEHDSGEEAAEETEEEYEEEVVEKTDEEAEEKAEEEAEEEDTAEVNSGEEEINDEGSEDSEDEKDEPETRETGEDVVSVQEVHVMTTSSTTIAVVEEAAILGPGHIPERAESDIEAASANEGHITQQQIHNTNGETILDESHEMDAQSLQSQPEEVLASFQSQISGPLKSPEPNHEDASEEPMLYDTQAEVEDERQDSGRDGDVIKEELVDDAKKQRPAEEMELDNENPQDTTVDIGAAEEMELDNETPQDGTVDTAPAEEMDVDDENPQNNTVDEGPTKEANPEEKTLEDVSGEQQDVPPSPPMSQHSEVHSATKSDASMTTVTHQVETQLGDQQQITYETQETETVLSQPATAKVDGTVTIEEKDVEMVDTAASSEVESEAEKIEDEPLSLNKEEEVIEEEVIEEEVIKEEVIEEEVIEEEEFDSTKPEPQNISYETTSPSPQKRSDDQAVNTPQQAIVQADGTHSDGDEDFHDVSEMDKSSPVTHHDENSSFVSATSEPPELDEAEHTSTAKPKRSKKARNDLSINFKRTPRHASTDLSPSSQRTTRSKAMSFQKASSPKEGQEDMSIQLARAALKSPTKKKVSTNSASRLKTTLIKRLANNLPDCLPLKDLKKFNSRNVDVAVVAVSTNTPPKRTPVREYVSSLTVTDPSLPSNGVVEVTIYSSHMDHLPIVKSGDSILLRSFTVRAFAGKGWGLKADKNTSSWAVFETDGDDPPQMRAAPVELNEEERKYLVDIRGWYASLDDGAKGKLGKAVGEMVDKGRENRGEK